MRDDFLCYPQRYSSKDYACLAVFRLSLCIQQLEYSCMRTVAEEMSPLCGTSPWQALLCKHDNFVNSRVTNLVLGICHAWPACCDLVIKAAKQHNSSMPHCIACSRSPHNVLQWHLHYKCLMLQYRVCASHLNSSKRCMDVQYFRCEQLWTMLFKINMDLQMIL